VAAFPADARAVEPELVVAGIDDDGVHVTPEPSPIHPPMRPTGVASAADAL